MRIQLQKQYKNLKRDITNKPHTPKPGQEGFTYCKKLYQIKTKLVIFISIHFSSGYSSNKLVTWILKSNGVS